MDPIPIALAAAVAVAVIPPLRRRVVPVTTAIAVGASEVAITALVGTRDRVEVVGANHSWCIVVMRRPSWVGQWPEAWAATAAAGRRRRGARRKVLHRQMLERARPAP